MFTGLISFLGGTAFRWLLGEVLGWMKARDERRAELALLKLQHDHDRDRAQWQREALAAAAAEGIRLVEAQTVAATARAADDAFLAAVRGVNAAGQRADWIGGWNAAIRPLLATISIALLVGQAVAPAHVVLPALTMEIVSAVLGLFVGERIHLRSRAAA